MSPRLPLLFMCLTLAACSRSMDSTPAEAPADAPSEAPSEPPAAANAPPAVHVLNTVDLREPVSLNGTEPFWGLTVKPEGIKLSRPDAPEKDYMPADFVVNGNQAALQTGELTVNLAVATCSDGMSERRYPLTAEVHVGTEVLKGCAMATAEMAKSRP